jgi:hypothetical protein
MASAVLAGGDFLRDGAVLVREFGNLLRLERLAVMLLAYSAAGLLSSPSHKSITSADAVVALLVAMV